MCNLPNAPYTSRLLENPKNWISDRVTVGVSVRLRVMVSALINAHLSDVQHIWSNAQIDQMRMRLTDKVVQKPNAVYS